MMLKCCAFFCTGERCTSQKQNGYLFQIEWSYRASDECSIVSQSPPSQTHRQNDINHNNFQFVRYICNNGYTQFTANWYKNVRRKKNLKKFYKSSTAVALVGFFRTLLRSQTVDNRILAVQLERRCVMANKWTIWNRLSRRAIGIRNVQQLRLRCIAVSLVSFFSCVLNAERVCISNFFV